MKQVIHATTSTTQLSRTKGTPVFHVLRRSFIQLAMVLRRIIGAPDYQTYVEHSKRCRPDAVPLTRREFEKQRLHDRYSRPGSRCC